MKNGALTKPENSCCPPTERIGDPIGSTALGYQWTAEFVRQMDRLAFNAGLLR
jgi:hypothetical protein